MKKFILALITILLAFPATAGAVTSVPWGRTGTTITPWFSSDTVQIPSLGGSGTRCVQTDNTGILSFAASACGAGGGGSGGGTWATTTSNVLNQLINYSNNTTDIVTIGGTATTSANSFIDPNGSGTISLNKWIYATTTAVVCKTAGQCPYTSIQTALNAGWTNVYYKNGVYSEQISLPSSKITLIGESENAIIQCNGITQSPCITTNSKDEWKIFGGTIRETNASLNGIAFDFSESAKGLMFNTRINNFATSTYGHDSTNNTFYNKFIAVDMSNPRSCIDIGGTQANENIFQNIQKCVPMAVDGGVGISVSDARGLTFDNVGVEGTTTTKGNIGWYFDATSRDNQVKSTWTEAIGTGVSIASGANNINFVGGTITSNGTDISDLGTNTSFQNVNRTGTKLNQLIPFSIPSITGTSTIVNALQLGSTAGDNGLKFTATRDYPSSNSTGGAVRFTCTANAASCFGIYTNHGAGATNDVQIIQIDNAAFDRRGLQILNDGVANALLVNCTNTAMTADCIDVTSSDSALTALGISGAAKDHSNVKATGNDDDGINGNGSNANSAVYGAFGHDANMGFFYSGSDSVTGLGSTTGNIFVGQNYDNQRVFQIGPQGKTGYWDITPDAMIEIVSTSTTPNGLGAKIPYFYISSTASADGDILKVDNAGLLTVPYASTTAISATTICLTGDTCRTTWPTSGAGSVGNWFFGTTNFNAVASATSTPLWLQAGLQASTTSYFDYASTTVLTVSGTSYLGTVGTGVLTGATGLPLTTGVTGILPIANGGTGQTSFSQGWLGANDAGAIVSSTSPTINYFTATSTATSTITGPLGHLSGSRGDSYFNTVDPYNNAEWVRMFWSGNIFNINAEKTGTGTVRGMSLLGNNTILGIGSDTALGGSAVTVRRDSTTVSGLFAVLSSNLNSSSALQNAITVGTRVSQTGTAGFRGLFISPFISSSGSLGSYLIDAGTNSAINAGGTHTSKFTVNDSGDTVHFGSTTLQNFTGLNATTTNATSTQIFSNVLTAGTVCLTADTCRTTWPTGSGSSFAFPFTPATNYGITTNSTTSPLWFKDQLFASSSAIIAGQVTANNFVATNTNATSTFAGSINVGSGLFNGQFAPQGFFGTTGNPQIQVANNTDDALSEITIGNAAMGAFTTGCLTFVNGNTPSSGGVSSTYNANICLAGPNFAAYPGLQANGMVIDNTDGSIVLGALSSNYASSSIALAVGPGTTAANYDFILQNLNPTVFPTTAGYANVGIGSTTPMARLAITASSTNGLPYFLIASTTNGTNSTNGTVSPGTVFIINNNANVGIASSSPGTRLGVMGSAVIADYVNASRFLATSTVASSIFPYASSTQMFSAVQASSTNQTVGVSLGVGTTSPASILSVKGGSIYSVENVLATSTSIIVDLATTSNQTLIQLGTSATTITLQHMLAGMGTRIITCNPNASAGAVTFATSPAGLLQWTGGTPPTQTTTANKCDVWTFTATQGTSTSAASVKVFGAQVPNF